MILYNSKERIEDCIGDTKYVNRCWLYLKPSLMLLKSSSELLKIKEQIVAVSLDITECRLCLYIKLKPTNIDLVNAIKALAHNFELVDESIFGKQLHKIVVAPDINYNAFLEGAYSKIYTPEQVEICFKSESTIKQIITKDKNYEDDYLIFLNKCFNGHIKKDSITEYSEYDIPPCLNQEIYGCTDFS